MNQSINHALPGETFVAPPLRLACQIAAFAFLISAASAVQLVAQVDKQRIPPLHLIQVRSIPIGDSIALTSFAVNDTGFQIAWATLSGQIRVWKRQGIDKFPERVTNAVSIAFRDGEHVLEVLAKEPARVVRFQTNGRLLTVDTLDVNHPVDVATRWSSGWCVGGRSIDGKQYRLTCPPSASQSLTSFHSNGAFLSTAFEGNELIVSGFRYPFRIVRVSPHGQILGRFDPALPAKRSASSLDQFEHWISLPVISLGKVFIQTLADLASDERVFAVYDESGHLVRINRLNAPLGFVAASPDSNILVGVRVGFGRQIIIYRWRWNAKNSTKEN